MFLDIDIYPKNMRGKQVEPHPQMVEGEDSELL